MTQSTHSADTPQNGGSAPQRLYEVAGAVAVGFVTGRKDVLSYFDAEYGRFLSGRRTRPQIEVHVGDYRRLTASPGFLTYRGRHKTITWKTALRDLDGDTTTLAFQGKGTMAVSFLQTFYLEPLLRTKLLQAGYALIHGSAIVKGTDTVLFPGGTGVGKTTLALQQAMAGRTVQGDNYVVVSPKGETHPFPRRLRIYSDLARTNPDAFRSLPIRERLYLRLLGLLRRVSLGYVNMPSRLRIEQLVPGHRPCPRGQLQRVFVLTPHGGTRLDGPTPLTLEQLIEKVQAIGRSEGSRLSEVVAPYLASHPESHLHRVAEMERDILVKALKDLPAFELLVPRVVNVGPLASEIGRISGLGEEPPGQERTRR